MLEPTSQVHKGHEVFRRVYSLQGLGDQFDVQVDTYSAYMIRPDTVTLEWTRERGEGWVRFRGFQDAGSGISGGRVLKNGVSEKIRATVNVWSYHQGTVGSAVMGLTEYAASIPGLADQIRADEKLLPGMDNDSSN